MSRVAPCAGAPAPAQIGIARVFDEPAGDAPAKPSPMRSASSASIGLLRKTHSRNHVPGAIQRALPEVKLDKKSVSAVVVFIAFAAYLSAWYLSAKYLAPHIPVLAYFIPLILAGLGGIPCVLGLTGWLAGFISAGCGWFCVCIAGWILSSASQYGNMAIKEGISVADMEWHSEDAFHFTDGYVAVHLQVSDSYTSCTTDNEGHETCTTQGWAVAPVFPGECTTESCQDRGDMSFIALALGANTKVKIFRDDGKDCPNSLYAGICAHTPLTGDRKKIQNSCYDMMDRHGLSARALCEDWPYLELGDVQEAARKAYLTGHIIFGMSASCFLCAFLGGCFAAD